MADEQAQMSTQQAAPPEDEISKKLDEQAQMSTQQAAPSVDESSKKLREVMEAVDRAIDSNKLSKDVREDWQKLSSVLNKIQGRLLITPKDHTEDDSVKKGDQEDHPDDSVKKDGQEEQQQPLHESKREELVKSLLPEIERALEQLMKQPRHESSDGNVRKKKLVPAGCSPLINKLRLSQEKKSREQGGGGHKKEEEEAVSVKLLVRLAEHVLEPEQYYEWTTSYVDESRIYGWDKEAEEVIKSLIGPDEGDFRAAAITGIHGSGKTALAQKVFVHDLAKDHFPIRLWVCVGPPDSEDRFNLLYRMLDNLGLDTNKIEDVIVDGAKVVNQAREKVAEAEIPKEERDRLRKEAAEMAKKRKQEEEEGVKKRKEEDTTTAAAGVDEGEKKEEAGTEDAKVKEEDAEIINKEYSKLIKQKIDDDKLLKEKIENSVAVKKSKIGVLLYILHVTLSKTGYLIVFDDIRVYQTRDFGDDGWYWYQNLTLPPPPEGVEWSDRLGYGLPKMTGKHRNAVLVTCRKEDDAKVMVRAGRVFRPPPLEVDNGWRLFEREFKLAKELKVKDSKENKEKVEREKDLLFKELEEMKKEIVEKCLGLPVAIIEAAKGFALSEYGPLPEPPEEAANKSADDKIGSSKKGTQTEGEQTEATTDNKPEES